MKCFTTWILIIALAGSFSGCATMQPIDGSPTELQQFINSGQLLKPGDRVRIVTADENVHRFAITQVEAGQIMGSNESVRVDKVMSLEMEKVKSSGLISFDAKDAFPWALLIAVIAMKPITVDSTPTEGK